MINRILLKLKKQFKISFGFSLIELMVVVAILALIILGLVSLFSGGVHSYISGNAQLEAQRNARQAMDRMVRELRHGKRVTSYTAHSITVQIPEIDGTPGYKVTFSWSGNPHDTLYRTDTKGDVPSTTPCVDDVLNLDFDNTKSNRIIIKLEVDVDRDEKADISLKTAVNLRNF